MIRLNDWLAMQGIGSFESQGTLTKIKILEILNIIPLDNIPARAELRYGEIMIK